MATELAKAYVQIMPSAKGIKGKITEELGSEASSAGKSAGMNIASCIKKTIAAAGIGTALKASLEEGGNLQQSIGGIETLFKDSADKVIESARNAYKTAGMSANEYMETVTSFSASLLQGLAGDTDKAAGVADMALTDMSDNANKMGTSMELIQNAYQGFAKQNYTMLDNLKLGYGGTKTEMQRLLADAQKLTGVKYDLNNLSDVYEAIHVIQEEMGITGTTAKEAASTLSGSMASMKAAFTNVLGNLSLGKDIGPSLNALGETVFTFLTGNLAPMVGNILSNLPELIESAMGMAIRGLNLVANNADVLVQNGIELIGQLVTGILSALPYLAEAAVNIVVGLGNALINTDWVGVATGILTQLRDNLSLAAGEILGTDGSIVNSLFDGIINSLPAISEGITSAFQFLWDACNNIWMTVGQPIWDTIMSVFQYVADNWDEISAGIQEAFRIWWDYVQTVWTNIGQPVFDAINNILNMVKDAFAERMPAIQEFVGTCFKDIGVFWENNLKPCLEAIGKFIKEILAPAFEAVFNGFIGPIIDTVFGYIKNLWEHTLKPVFTGITDFLTGVFTLNFKQAWEGIKSILKGFFNSSTSGVEAFINGCISALNGLIEGINFLVGKAGGIFGLDISIPTIGLVSLPKLARGGILEKGQLGLLEGSGAEAVVPLDQNEKWISQVARDMNTATGDSELLLKILEVLLELGDTMPDRLAEAVSMLKLVVNNREFGRLVREVAV